MKVLNHIGISGGKDSTALLLWAVHESGYPKESIVASFCDTGNEAPQTYDYVEMLSQRVHPITTLKPERGFYDMVRHKARFPSSQCRFCTTELKMIPTRLFIHALRELGCEVLLHSGVRASESADRALLPPRELSTFFGCEVFRPLLSWTIEDVWAIHARYGIPRNPLYDMGAQRVGCWPCIHSRKAEIALLARQSPERIAFLREKETETGSSHRDGFSSFFTPKKVPARYRSKTITTKDGRRMNVCTIDDVVQWALDSPELYQQEFEFDPFAESAPACDSRLGVCE